MVLLKVHLEDNNIPVTGDECMVDVRPQSGGSPGPFWRKICLSLLAVAIVGVCVFMFLTGSQEESIAQSNTPKTTFRKHLVENIDLARPSLA